MMTDGGKVKGTAVSARMQYIERRWGQPGLALAQQRFNLAHGSPAILAASWYPRTCLATLESVAAKLGNPMRPFLQKEMGASEARCLLTGPYAHLSRKNPGGMASSLTLIFSCIYLDIKLSIAEEKEFRCLFRMESRGFSPPDGDFYAGFLGEAMSMVCGRAVDVTWTRDAGERFLFSVSWERERKDPTRETVAVSGEFGIMESRSRVRKVGQEMGFGTVDMVGIATCISELARNIVNYAGEGTITIEDTVRGGERCMWIQAHDNGPGIRNLDEIMGGRHRSERGMGMGLRAIKKLADEFRVTTGPGQGTTVEIVKYVKRH